MQIMSSRNPKACIIKQVIKGQGRSELFTDLCFRYLGFALRCLKEVS